MVLRQAVEEFGHGERLVHPKGGEQGPPPGVSGSAGSGRPRGRPAGAPPISAGR
jgi:hypothetical protein